MRAVPVRRPLGLGPILLWVDSPAVDAVSARTRRVLTEAAAVLWLLVCAAGFLAPALSHGKAIGPYDVLGLLGLTRAVHPLVHNADASGQIQQFIPWQVLAWRQVHAGDVPLWQPSNLLGMPLFANFQSAPFGLANVVGYAFPLALAHSATVATELVLAGTGTYVLGRMLRLDVLPAVMGATVFELCGAFTIWLGVDVADVGMLVPWVLAASVAVLRRPRGRRIGPAVLLAVGLALAFAAGEPQIDVYLVLFVGVFAAVVATGRRHQVHTTTGQSETAPGPAAGALLAHLGALAAAAGLVAPIYLPGAQVLARSARVRGPYVSSLPPHDITHLLFVGYSGIPTSLASIIGANNLYVSMVYVGSVALILALVGLVWIRQRPEVRAFLLLAVVLLAVLFLPQVAAVMRHIPEAKLFRLDLGTTFLDFAFAMLGAFGAQALLVTWPRAESADRSARNLVIDPLVPQWTDRLLVVGTAFIALELAVLETRLGVGLGHLKPAQSAVRQSSFVWPAIGVAACALLATIRTTYRPPGTAQAVHHPVRRVLERAGGVVSGSGGLALLVGVEAAFGVIGGAWFVSSTPNPLPVTRTIAALRHDVGGRLVGMGTCPQLHAFPGVGVMPDVNAVYGIDELAGDDPAMTTQYYGALGGLLHTSRTPPSGQGSLFCPEVTSARMARFFGVAYVLEPPGTTGPPGTRFVTKIRGEGLYSVPRSGRVTLVPLPRGTGGGTGGRWSSTWEGDAGALPAVQRARESEAGTWRIDVLAHTRSLLVARVTAVPGWHATIDGRPLRLRTYDTVLLAATVPPGHHVVVLHYWPGLLSVGLLVAAASAAALAVAYAWSAWRRRGPGAGAPPTPLSNPSAHAAERSVTS